MERDKLNIIRDVVEKGCTRRGAAAKLKCSERHVRRLINLYKEQGEKGFIHGNAGRCPSNKVDEARILLLYEKVYYDFNLVFFSEKLKEHEGIAVSEGTLRNIFKMHDKLSIKAHRETKRLLKKKLKEVKKLSVEQTDQLIQLETEDFTGSIHPSQPRSKYFGEEIQGDACNHEWFGGMKSFLHIFIDDATGRIIAGRFELQETLYGYYHILRDTLTRFGIPILIKTDRRTIFDYQTRKMKEMNKDTFTQFAHACSTLGIDLQASSVPEFKPRVERSFQTLQGRLPQEMRLADVTTLEQARLLHPEIQ